ncbi:ATP-binding protein [Frigidibacter sp. MR17.14]|uniref:ATP-binding protein n=1 Tax=Frigidibacter sp. MR17.14 TaxID=3126509 RepID=UPI00301313DB
MTSLPAPSPNENPPSPAPGGPRRRGIVRALPRSRPVWIKRWLPRGLYGRSLLILAVPVIALQIVITAMVVQRLYEDVTDQMTRSLVSGLASILSDVEGSADALTAARAAGDLSEAAGVSLLLPAETPTRDQVEATDISGRTVISTLRAQLEGVRGVDLSRDRLVRLGLDTKWGPMLVEFDRRRVSASNPHQLIVLMAITGVLMTGIAFIFLRNQLKPIKRLAQAAEDFGRGRSTPYRPSGASEVRSAGAAFLDMRARLERQMEQRTMMLSGVSHDLRTPLTRMKLELAMLPEEEETLAMARDITEMERLIDAFLAFARGDAQDSEVEVLEPVAFLTALQARAERAGQPVTLGDMPAVAGSLKARPGALGRAIDNLVGNGVRYGNCVEVSLTDGDGAVVFSVEDDGPGIPRERRDEALRPFARLDPARNQDRGSGVGLGLAIAADVARSHGGTLRLGESERLGGLKADLIIPR